ncbi:MAG: DUF4105 domain-containing protein [Deltaproteobacteria bacterium]|nr:DUF4105 domain-containing protein [Deltaproteobacteria bacterium]
MAALFTVAAMVSLSRARDPLDDYVASLVAKAHEQNLAEDEMWLRLGHYRKTLFGNWKSEQDNRAFFLAEDGKADPQAELDATLRGIFAPEIPNEKGSVQHPLCRFPARAMFLARALDIDMGRVRQRDCPRVRAFAKALNPKGVSLVFSSYYLNNPASAFGHTFLRFHRGSTANGSERADLTDFGIDFAANVDTRNAFVYAFKGLSGLFPGTFHRIPYYYKVREYNDYESRDLWEYELDLTDQELLMLTAHIWELGSAHFDYFYLTENCSYHILGALEGAGPRFDLIDKTRFPVLPADTVKIVWDNPDLVRRIRFRPSIRTQFQSRAAMLSNEELDLVAALARDPDAPLPEGIEEDRVIAVFDAAADLIDLTYAKELILKTDGDAAELKRRLLARRAAIRRPSPSLDYAAPPSETPHNGHGAMRVGVGGGGGGWRRRFRGGPRPARFARSRRSGARLSGNVADRVSAF